jgi:hypothetical protein
MEVISLLLAFDGVIHGSYATMMLMESQQGIPRNNSRTIDVYYQITREKESQVEINIIKNVLNKRYRCLIRDNGSNTFDGLPHRVEVTILKMHSLINLDITFYPYGVQPTIRTYFNRSVELRKCNRYSLMKYLDLDGNICDPNITIDDIISAEKEKTLLLTPEFSKRLIESEQSKKKHYFNVLEETMMGYENAVLSNCSDPYIDGMVTSYVDDIKRLKTKQEVFMTRDIRERLLNHTW